MFHSVYIAGAEPRSGKSLVALGMMEMLTAMTPRVGHFRPVVRENHGSDPLGHLIGRRYDLNLPAENMYGVTQEQAVKMLSQGQYEELLKIIVGKYKTIEQRYDVMVCTGSDFSGCTSPLELDFNADLANNLGCLLLPVVKGHGRTPAETADAVMMLEEYLDGQHCELLAAFVNRVDKEQVDEVKDRLNSSKLPFYVLPERAFLQKPTVGEIARSMKLEHLAGDARSLNHVVECYQVAAMPVQDLLERLENCSLVITPGNRSDIILGTLAADASHETPGIAGILLTGGQRPAASVQRVIDGLTDCRVPILLSDLDTFDTALKVNEVRGSILPGDESKIALALGVMESSVDLPQLAELLVRKPSQRMTRMTPLMFEYELIRRAKSQAKHIVLPESTDERVLRAAEILSLREVVRVTLLGNAEVLRQRQQQLGLRLKGVNVVDPSKSAWRQEFAERYFELRMHKGMTLDMAADTMLDVSYFGTMMVQCGYADGMVSGAAHTTQHTIRPAFEIIRTRADFSLVSSVFFMCLADRVLVYGDCAINPNPNAGQLADIAIASSETARIFGIEPRTALLSYSTGESGKGDDVDHVRQAARFARQRRPDLKIEGPIQYDAAVDLGVANSKLPGSEVAGQATVFIFPDLNTGNNTYKAVQRSADAVAIGPVLQGLNKPVNDLSRGCTVTDIVNTVVITAIQAQQKEQAQVASNLQIA